MYNFDETQVDPAETRTPTEWARSRGVRILSADGWSTAADFARPITLAEHLPRESASSLEMPAYRPTGQPAPTVPAPAQVPVTAWFAAGPTAFEVSLMTETHPLAPVGESLEGAGMFTEVHPPDRTRTPVTGRTFTGTLPLDLPIIQLIIWVDDCFRTVPSEGPSGTVGIIAVAHHFHTFTYSVHGGRVHRGVSTTTTM